MMNRFLAAALIASLVGVVAACERGAQNDRGAMQQQPTQKMEEKLQSVRADIDRTIHTAQTKRNELVMKHQREMAENLQNKTREHSEWLNNTVGDAENVTVEEQQLIREYGAQQLQKISTWYQESYTTRIEQFKQDVDYREMMQSGEQLYQRLNQEYEAIPPDAPNRLERVDQLVDHATTELETWRDGVNDHVNRSLNSFESEFGNFRNGLNQQFDHRLERFRTEIEAFIEQAQAGELRAPLEAEQETPPEEQPNGMND